MGEGLLSPEALANPPAYGRARAVARFEDGPARLLVHRLKYGDRLELARPLGAWMARAGAELLAETDVVGPDPAASVATVDAALQPGRGARGHVARAAGVACDPFLLERVKATASQVGMTRVQRTENVQGAFRIPARSAAAVHGRRILLVDDVLTTGATLNAAAHVLLRGGAAKVDVLVFARVVTES